MAHENALFHYCYLDDFLTLFSADPSHSNDSIAA